jgi:monoamine oxidase
VNTDILIAGAGICGLSLAHSLQQAGQDFVLVEARDRIGGRVATVEVSGARFDIGPAWFWPGQPRIARLADEFGLQRFDQYCDGLAVFENEAGQVQYGRGYASMQGSFRLAGGLTSLPEALASRIATDRLITGDAVLGLEQTESGIRVKLASNRHVFAKKVVLAMPPRVAAALDYVPELPEKTLSEMNNIATWMAGQAKAVAVYEKPFWREAGLSGDAMSRHGPMVEVHDASPASGGPYALFGFIGVPPQGRKDAAQLEAAIRAQFGNLFGTQAQAPIGFQMKDWAFDPRTSVLADQKPLYAHPHYGLPLAMRDLWHNRLILSGTETASQFGGYLEGALEAAAHALTILRKA